MLDRAANCPAKLVAMIRGIDVRTGQGVLRRIPGVRIQVCIAVEFEQRTMELIRPRLCHRRDHSARHTAVLC